jgi:hypothetical protein
LIAAHLIGQVLRHSPFVGAEMPSLLVIVYLKYADRLALRQHGGLRKNRAWQGEAGWFRLVGTDAARIRRPAA